ncbi:acyl-CoA dehydrogenase family protein, partial [Microbacterium kyungheense]
MVTTIAPLNQTTPAPAAPNLTAEERAAILDAVRDFAQHELAPHALEWDAASHFPRETLNRGGDLGLGGIYVRDDFGGTGLSRSDAAAIFEELAKGDPAIAAYISIHNMVAWMIDTYGDEDQRGTWLPTLTAMTGFGSYCLTEPGAGSDAAAIATSAIRSGDEYVLTGVKQFISGGGEAAVYIVMARTDADAGARG